MRLWRGINRSGGVKRTLRLGQGRGFYGARRHTGCSATLYFWFFGETVDAARDASQAAPAEAGELPAVWAGGPGRSPGSDRSLAARAGRTEERHAQQRHRRAAPLHHWSNVRAERGTATRRPTV